jgi:hypothetical protein
MANKIDDAIKAAEKELPRDLTWVQAVDLIGDEAVSLWKISGKVAANDRLTDADRYRLADAIAKKLAKRTPTDVERAHEEYLDRVQNEWRHDKRKKQQTTHLRSDDPTKSEEALSDAIDEYRARITDEWRIPSLVEDARRKKQYYNAAGQEEGSSVEEEDDPEKSTSDAASRKKGDDAEKARADYIDHLENSWKTSGR